MNQQRRTYLLGLGLSPFMTNGFAQSDFFIPKQWLELFLWGVFPINKNIIIAEATIKDPEISLLASEQRVELKARYAVNGSALGQKSYEGSIALNSRLQYQANHRLVRLAEPRLELFTVDSDYDASQQITSILKRLVPTLLEQQVIYRFENNSSLLGKTPKLIEIETDGIRLQY
ncbi:MAG: DUF1439 domain-containing protein [Burkholderiales bacterium]|jgi:hypothetical protein|nr:DUF1439 domain-containing protein [Polynucleobacter sp.]MCX7245731.1 DUF1439 domain-containing protein [Burkholderiales bacterium]